MTLIYFILVLGIIIFIHELGHFIFAKKAGIHVYEFALGMGPRIFKFKRKNDETIYSIRIFPIGGFVSMAGEEIEVDREVPDDKQFFNKRWSQRFWVIIAGVLFNFILAIILLFIIGLVNGAPNNKPYINTLSEGYPIAETTLQKGDLIIGIDNRKIKSTDRLLLELHLKSGKTIEIEVLSKNNEKKKVNISPVKVTENDQELYRYGFTLENDIQKGFVPAIKFAFDKTYNLIEQMIIVVKSLITGNLGLNSLAGPIGIYGIVGESAKAGFISILYLIALISINVGFINIVPFPALDGGRLIFLIVEKIRGKKINPKIENTIHSVGFSLLLILMMVVIVNDIIKIV